MPIRLSHASTTEVHDEGRTCARIIGEEASALYPGQPWNAVETQMADEWRIAHRDSPLSWADVRGDAHAAWQFARLKHQGRQQDDAPVFAAAA